MSGLIGRVVGLGRRVAADYRPDTYDLLRVDTTPDDQGGWAETETVIGGGGCVLVPGNLRPEEREVAERESAVTPYAVRNMEWDSPVAAEHRLRINGRTFQVLGVLRAEAVNVAVTAICEERL